MLFDFLCRLSPQLGKFERHMLKHARIFVFDARTLDEFFEEFSSVRAVGLGETVLVPSTLEKYEGRGFDNLIGDIRAVPNMYTNPQAIPLPFPVTAICDDDSVCALLTDLDDGERFFLVGCHVSSDEIGSPGLSMVATGQLRPSKGEDRHIETIIRDVMYIQNRGRKYDTAFSSFGRESIDFAASMPPHQMQTIQKAISTIVPISFRALAQICSPHKFVLETTSTVKIRRKNKRGEEHIPRSAERPLYTILRPNRIREQMGLPQPVAPPPASGRKRKSPRPHDRRRTVNFLSAERYRYDSKTGRELEQKPVPYGPRKGQPYYKESVREAMWIGPKENQVGNKIYRVRLDL